LEIKELQDKLISLNSEYEEFKSKQVEETEKIHQTYKQKEAQILFEKELINKLTDENKKYHVPISKIVELIKLQIQNDVKPVIIEGKLSFVDANGNPKLNDLKTLHYSIDDVAKLASDLEIKSNGRGEKKEFELEDNKNITDKMKENRRRLAQTYIE
jgi:hypothetical protein